jgi:hypothetical protein
MPLFIEPGRAVVSRILKSQESQVVETVLKCVNYIITADPNF